MTRIGHPGIRPGQRQWGRHWRVLLFFIIVFFCTFPAVFLGHGQFYLRDFHPFFYPQKLFLSLSLAGGTIPLWQPHIGCGVPFFASLQPAVFYPPSLLLLLPGSFQLGLKFFVAFHFLLGFVSAAALARSMLRAGPWACCFTGTAFAFGGYLVSSVSQLNNLQSAAWAPLVLAAVLRLVRGRRLSGLAVTSLAVALQLLGGGVEVTGLTLAVAFALSCLPDKDGMGRSPLWRGPLLVSAAVLMALGLAACQVLPTMEMAGRSTRAGGGLEQGEAVAYSLQPGNLQNLAAPRRLSDPGEPGYFKAFSGGRVPWLISIYHGTVVLYLALLGLLAGGNRLALRLVLLACAVAGLVLAMGDATPVTAALFHALPGSGWFRYPEKFVFLAGLSLPLLACIGFRGLSGENGSRPPVPRPAVELAALLLPLALLLAAGRTGLGGGAEYSVALPLVLLALAAATRFLSRRNLLGSTVAALLLAILAAVDLSTAHRPLNDTVPAGFYADMPAAAMAIHGHREAGEAGRQAPPRCRSLLPGCPGGPPVTELAQATPLQTHLIWRVYLSPNSAGIHGISQVRGSTGMELRRPALREWLITVAGLPDKLALLSLWGVEYLLMDRELAVPDELAGIEFTPDLPGQRLYHLRRPLPRLFTLQDDLAGRYPGAEARLLQTGEGAAGYVQEIRADLELGRSLGEGVRIVAWEPQRVAAEVQTGRQHLLLAFTEGYDPGWRAMVDGRPALVRQGLGGFCLVQMPSGPGRYRVELTYGPPGLVPGLAVTGTAVLLLLLPAVLARRRRVDRIRGKT